MGIVQKKLYLCRAILNNLKRILVISIVLCYLGSLPGGVLFSHYCGGDFKYIAINSTEEKPSCCQGEMKEDGCCTNEQVSIDIDDHQQWIKDSFSVTHPELPQHPYSEYLVPHIIPLIFKIYGVAHSPPIDGSQPLYILYSVFRI